MNEFLCSRFSRGTCLVFLSVLMSIAIGSSCHAVILLDETWSDGSRTETNLPNESAVYASHADSVTMSVGSLAYTLSGSSQRLHTYYAADGSPASLGVGDKLITTIDFTSGNLNNSTSRNFRVGLFATPSAGHVTADGASDNGNTPGVTTAPWSGAQGYAAFMFLSSAPGTTQLFQIGKRIGANSLLGATGDYVQNTSGGGVAAAASNTDYSLRIELDRVATDQLDVTFSLSDATGVLATQTVSDTATMFGNQADATPLYTNFDMLAFRFSSTAGTSDVLTFRRFQVEHVVVPEPSSLALLSLGGMALALFRRRGA